MKYLNRSIYMRILIITNSFPPEKFGNSSRIFDMAHNLQKLGDDLLVIAPHPTYPPGTFKRKWSRLEHNNISGIEVINLLAWQPASRDPGFLSRMVYYLTFPFHTILWVTFNSRKFDVILTSSPPIFTGFGGLYSKLFFRKKWILDVRDLWIDASVSLGFLKKGSFFERISRAYERLCYSKADLITVTTKKSQLSIIETYKDLIENKILLFSNGVDTEIFFPISVDKKNQIIYSGNIGHAQDLENVILSMKEIKQHCDVKLLIVGDGDLKDHLEKLVENNNLQDIVIFKGLVSRQDVPKLISQSLIGLSPLKKLPSLEYAIPTKCYEYMACGIPFVGCGEGEIRSLAKASGGGLIAENSPNEISSAVLELLMNKQKREAMGKQGQEYVSNNFNRKHIAASLQKEIHNLLK